jgi:hypothetical protein
VTVSNHFRALAVAALAGITILLLVTTAEPAEAAFPGANGKIVFDSFSPGEADSGIFTLTYSPGGPVPEDPDPRLTDNTAQDRGAA